jgi:hypothetical protein
LADENLKDDKNFVLNIIKKHGRSLEFASERLKNDRCIVMEAIKNDGKSI